MSLFTGHIAQRMIHMRWYTFNEVQNNIIKMGDKQILFLGPLKM
jgi:hypothetical protein